MCSTRPDGNGDSTAGSPTGAAMDAIDTFLQVSVPVSNIPEESGRLAGIGCCCRTAVVQ